MKLSLFTVISRICHSFCFQGKQQQPLIRGGSELTFSSRNYHTVKSKNINQVTYGIGKALKEQCSNPHPKRSGLLSPTPNISFKKDIKIVSSEYLLYTTIPIFNSYLGLQWISSKQQYFICRMQALSDGHLWSKINRNSNKFSRKLNV